MSGGGGFMGGGGGCPHMGGGGGGGGVGYMPQEYGGLFNNMARGQTPQMQPYGGGYGGGYGGFGGYASPYSQLNTFRRPIMQGGGGMQPQYGGGFMGGPYYA